MTSFRNRLFGNGLYFLSQLTRRTGQYQIDGLDHLYACQEAGRPIIWTAWHGMTMMLSGFLLRRYDPGSLIIMMPDDWRGETLAHWARRVGAIPSRMNLKGDASMATARKLARLIKTIREGQNAYVTPDGPDGPAYEVKPGVAYIGQKTGAAVLPCGAYTRTGHRLNRWDRYVVPRPFSRISVVIGPAVPAPAGVPAEVIANSLTDALHRVTMQAAANYYERR